MDLRLLIFITIYIIVNSASAIDGSISYDLPIEKADVEFPQQENYDDVLENLIHELEDIFGTNELSNNKEQPSSEYNSERSNNDADSLNLEYVGITEESSNKEGHSSEYNSERSNDNAGSSYDVYRSRNYPQGNLYEIPLNLDESSEQEGLVNKVENVFEITEQSSNKGEPTSGYDFEKSNCDVDSSDNVQHSRNYPQAKSYEIPEYTDERQPSNRYNYGKTISSDNLMRYFSRNFPQRNLYTIRETFDDSEFPDRYNFGRSNYLIRRFSDGYGSRGSYRKTTPSIY